jgi:hypothetical protein
MMVLEKKGRAITPFPLHLTNLTNKLTFAELLKVCHELLWSVNQFNIKLFQLFLFYSCSVIIHETSVFEQKKTALSARNDKIYPLQGR